MSKITSIIAFFSPIDYLFLLIGVAMAFDTIFGRWAAKKYAKNNNIPVREFVTSKNTFDGILLKMAIYGLIMTTIFVIDERMFNMLVCYFAPNFPFEYVFSNIAGLLIIMHEADSIDEKVYKVKGQKIREIFIKGIKGLKSFILELLRFKNDLKQN